MIAHTSLSVVLTLSSIRFVSFPLSTFKKFAKWGRGVGIGGKGKVMFSQVSVCRQSATWLLGHRPSLLRRGRSASYWRSRYASYWNTFLLSIFVMQDYVTYCKSQQTRSDDKQWHRPMKEPAALLLSNEAFSLCKHYGILLIYLRFWI